MKYIILRDGYPDFENALELPCTEREVAEKEVERLEALQRERNAKPVATGRGSAFLNVKTDYRWKVKEV